MHHAFRLGICIRYRLLLAYVYLYTCLRTTLPPTYLVVTYWHSPILCIAIGTSGPGFLKPSIGTCRVLHTHYSSFSARPKGCLNNRESSPTTNVTSSNPLIALEFISFPTTC
ncbi:hypothetical protein F5Y09DRAFT_320409, partial [Xylaria sp. FL1042]